jgi:hypothetical protein
MQYQIVFKTFDPRFRCGENDWVGAGGDASTALHFVVDQFFFHDISRYCMYSFTLPPPFPEPAGTGSTGYRQSNRQTTGSPAQSVT